MARQSRPSESEIGYSSALSPQTQALADTCLIISRTDSKEGLELDRDKNISFIFSENDIYYHRKSLFQPPLNLDRWKDRLHESKAHDDSQHDDEKLIDSNPLNQRLPIEPGLLDSPVESSGRDGRPHEALETICHYETSPTSTHSTKLRHDSNNEQWQESPPSPVLGILATEGFERSDPRGMSHFSTFLDEKAKRLALSQSLNQRCHARHIRSQEPRADSQRTKLKNIRFRHILDGAIGKHAVPKIPRQLTVLNTKMKSALTRGPFSYYQPSTLEGMTEPHERRLLSRFFGFDGTDPLDERRLHIIQYYLTIQPDPDFVIGQKIYPVAACVWLRHRILTSFSRPPFDRGRLRGLLLKDSSTQTVNRGFGLLWEFLKDCGSRARCKAPSKEDTQREWFQKHVQRSETEHMLQIWNALKILLLKQSAERQGPGQADPDGANVIEFMKRGLGEIQQYLTGRSQVKQPFRDGTTTDRFFVEACLRHQGEGAFWSEN